MVFKIFVCQDVLVHRYCNISEIKYINPFVALPERFADVKLKNLKPLKKKKSHHVFDPYSYYIIGIVYSVILVTIF